MKHGYVQHEHMCMWKVSVHKSIIAYSDYNANVFIATMLNNILIGYPSQDGICYFGPVVIIIDANVR